MTKPLRPPVAQPLAALAVALAVLALAAGVATAAAFRRHDMDGRLMRSFADRNPEDPALVRYAVSRATPVYRAHCAGCHGADMKGDPSRGAADLVDAEWLYGEGRVSQIEQTLLYGIRSRDVRSRNLADMPGFSHARPYQRYDVPTLTGGEIDAVIDYIQSLAGKRTDPARAAAGRVLYHDKAQCFDCHEMDARGDSFIGAPNLIDAVWLYGDGSREAIRASVARGRAGVCPSWSGKLPPPAIRALALLIHERAAPVPAGNAPP